MKNSIIITLAIAAAIACTACGKQENETASPVISVSVSETSCPKTEVTTTAVTTAKVSKPVQSTSLTKAAETTSVSAVTTVTTYIDTTTQTEQVIVTTTSAPIQTTVTETTTLETTTASTTEALQTATTTQTQSQSQRPAGTPPSPDNPDYAPAPIQYDIDGITYIQGALIANKSYSLPADFNPGLDPTCQKQFNKMVSDASQQGINLTFGSGFRSYSYQNTLYNNYVARDGLAAADSYSARAGYSEHQSGLAIDVNSISHYFDGTPEALWLENHCHEYGFILRYPKDKESITGYQYESWHIRYLGTDLSYAIHNSGLTLEEYFGIDSYYH